MLSSAFAVSWTSTGGDAGNQPARPDFLDTSVEEVPMTRIDEDATASDDLLKSWTSEDEEPRVIQSHRAPRIWLRRHTRAVLGILAVSLALGGAGVVSRGAPERAGATLALTDRQAGAQILDVPVASEPTKIIEDPVPRRAETPRVSRSQRKAIVQPNRSTQTRAARWVAPLLGKLKVTSCFGVYRGDHTHEGLDLDGETGDIVRSVGVGRVVQVGYRFSGAGLTVTVQHGNTLVLYAHLSATSVKVGRSVAAGQKVGELGSTGNSTGSHLHFGVAKTTSLGKLWDRLVNPVPWLEARGVAVPGRC